MKIENLRKWTLSTEALPQGVWFESGFITKPSYAKATEGEGGEYRSRTGDLLHAMQTL